MADPMLRRVVDVLLGLQMLSEGKTYGWDKTRVSSTADSGVPVRFSSDGHLREHEWSPYEYHRWRISTASNTSELADRILAAEKGLRVALTGPEELPDGIPHEPGQLRLWVVLNCEGMKATEIAERCGMSVAWVRDIRKRAKRHPNTGAPIGGSDE
jgi:hypothetical protein